MWEEGGGGARTCAYIYIYTKQTALYCVNLTIELVKKSGKLFFESKSWDVQKVSYYAQSTGIGIPNRTAKRKIIVSRKEERVGEGERRRDWEREPKPLLSTQVVAQNMTYD